MKAELNQWAWWLTAKGSKNSGSAVISSTVVFVAGFMLTGLVETG